MDDGRTGMGRARAIIAVIALYGLLLQGVLAGMLPGASFAADGHAICAPDATSSAPDGGPTTRHGATCCTLACGPVLPALPSAAWSPSDWPSREAALIVWTVRGALVPTGPPVHASSARGPPLA